MNPSPTPPAFPDPGQGREPSIGALISQTRNLSAEQVEQVLAYQRQHGLRFGDAAVQLGFASTDDVLFALAQQFQYPVAPSAGPTLSPELVSLSEPFGRQAEAFRAARSQLLMRLQQEGRERRALAVVSPEQGDGKSFFCANLAVALAQLGGRTLLIDADMRHPRQHQLFRLEEQGRCEGLADVLSGRAGQGVIRQVQGVPSLFVLPVGTPPPNPLELVERPAFVLLLRDLLGRFDHVLIDTPAATLGSDSTVIAARAGAAVVLARRHQSRMAALQDLVGSFSHSPAEILGVIFNEH